MCPSTALRAESGSPPAIASRSSWWRAADMLANAVAGPRNRIATRIGPVGFPGPYQGRVAGEFAQQTVEGQVRLHHVADGAVHGSQGIQRRLQSAEHRRTVRAGTEIGGSQPLETGTDGEHVRKLRSGQRPDRQPAPIAHLDQSLVLQLPQRLPQRPTRDPHRGRQFRLHQSAARLDLPRRHRRAQQLHRPLPQAGPIQLDQTGDQLQLTRHHQCGPLEFHPIYRLTVNSRHVRMVSLGHRSPGATSSAADPVPAFAPPPRPAFTGGTPMTTSTQRTVVITGVGAERGIGRATAHRFAKDGWAVAGLDLDGDASAKLAAELTEQYGVPAYGGTVNVADEESVLAARDAVHAADLPVVGAVLNIAGITSPVPFLETTLDLWNKIFAVNATGTYLVTKAFLPDMIDGGYGRIVNMSSVSAQQGGGVFGKTPYSSAKAAVIGFTRSLARELGPTGITVNAIAAGAVDTDIRVQGTTPELEASIVASVPLGRQASVDDVTALFAFLASEEAGYITATTQNLNGGSYIA